jgi:cytochrome c oxidase subunit 6b
MAPKLNVIFSEDPNEGPPAFVDHMKNLDPAKLKVVNNVKTTPRDDRFPATNQALHCWNRYNEWLLCAKEGSEDTCKPLRQYAESICPEVWTTQWDEERDTGVFNGIGSRFHNGH